jgi:hypothetical protein
MRAYSYYRTHNFLYVVNPESPHYEQCFRSHLKCELTLSNAKAERLLRKKKRLTSEIAAIYAKTTRFRKQHRAIIKKLRDLDNRENRNILELKIDEILSKIPVKSAEILNLFSPRSSSFLNPALLNSPGKTLTEPLSNR